MEKTNFKKVLIIAYYWPPSGGSGVQRWLKFVKYMRSYGLEPVVYTVDNPNYEVVDESLTSEIPSDVTVLKRPIFEPNKFFKKNKVATAKVSSNPSLVQRLLQYVRGNFFMPDARMFWIKPSIKYLTNYLSDNKIDIVISTGPPHSMHMIGMALKKKLGIKWLADFRDPMSKLFYNNDLYLSDRTKVKIEKLEKKIIQSADKVVTVSKYIQQDFNKYRDDVELITNGFDIEYQSNDQVNLDKEFSFSHIGLFPYQSNPNLLWEVLEELTQEIESFASHFKLNLIGNVSGKVLESIYSFNLKKYVNLIDYVPHEKAIEYQRKSQVLLLVIPQVDGAEGIITGKVFEYINSNRPVLALAPLKSDLIDVIENTKTGRVVDYNNKEILKSTILEMYIKFQEGSLSVQSENIGRFHRKELTHQMSNLIKETLAL